MGMNDYHITIEESTDAEGKRVQTPILHPGTLGADEPSEEMKSGARERAALRLEKLKRELSEEAEALTERERLLEERERRVALAEAGLARSTGGSSETEND